MLRLALARSSRRLRQQAGHELSPSRAAVLATIAREGPISPSALASLERVSRPTVTRLVEKLAAAGLVDCSPDPADGRSYLISLSESGSALRELRHARKNAYVAKLIANASPEELDVLERAAVLLLRLIDEDE